MITFFEDTVHHSSRMQLYADEFGIELHHGLGEVIHDQNKFTQLELIFAMAPQQGFSKEVDKIVTEYHRLQYPHHKKWDFAPHNKLEEAAFDKLDATHFPRSCRPGQKVMPWKTDNGKSIETIINNSGPGVKDRQWWWTEDQKKCLLMLWVKLNPSNLE